METDEGTVIRAILVRKAERTRNLKRRRFDEPNWVRHLLE
jgi:hypothetical protein